MKVKTRRAESEHLNVLDTSESDSWQWFMSRLKSAAFFFYLEVASWTFLYVEVAEQKQHSAA